MNELKRVALQAIFVIGFSLATLVDNIWVQAPCLLAGISVAYHWGRIRERNEQPEDA